MSVGSFLFGVGVLLLTLAYLARPFRPVRTTASFGGAIDGWVEQARGEQEAPSDAFCGQCGRRVGADDRFCPGCGKPLATAASPLAASPQDRSAEGHGQGGAQ